MDQHQFLEKNAKKIDYSFIGLVLAFVLGFGLILGVSNTYNSANKSLTAPDSPTVDYTYENFWNKFNTYSAVAVKMQIGRKNIAQEDIDTFQTNFFNLFGLTEQDKNIYSGGEKVNPVKLFCYMNQYDPNKNNALTVLKNCKTAK